MESSWPPQQSGGHSRVIPTPQDPLKHEKRMSIAHFTAENWVNFEIQTNEFLPRYEAGFCYANMHRGVNFQNQKVLDP